ncbi:MAG: hypothetical protein KF832_19610 [Caldilineaceae bacterium]|nr:hypothetical protein [Caldilineaceae bacterium]
MLRKNWFLIALLLFGALWFLPHQPLATAAPMAHDDATATPIPAEASTDDHAADAHVGTEEPTLTDLTARVHALEEQLAAEHSRSGGADLNQVTTAIYLLDTAGLHDLDVRLNEEGVIEPGDAGRVNRVVDLLASVNWPEPLVTEVVTLTTALTDLGAALTADDVEAAAPLATLVHEAQHDFSHAVEQWAEHAPAPAPDAGQAFRVTSAVYLLDTAGLHDLDVRLNEEALIEPGDAGTVKRVARLLASVDWPEPLATEVVTLTTALTDLATALTNDDVEAAAPLATTIHEVQHAFSHAAEHWLGEMLGGQSDDGHGSEGHGEEATAGDHGDHGTGDEGSGDEGSGDEGGEAHESSGG